jgi:ATP-GRASP peptide maturase of grasp-with-spasm system
MVLIFSDNRDKSTDNVIDWMTFFKVDFLRITSRSPIRILKIDINEELFSFGIDDKIVNSEQITGYWYRRDEQVILNPLLSLKTKNKLEHILFQYSKIDSNILRNFLVYLIEKKSKKIGSFFNHDLNKLYQLSVAKKVGLKIPFSQITDNLADLKDDEKYITKGLSQIFDFYNKHWVKNYTNQIKKTQKENFTWAFVQNLIPKRYEIRVFFLNGITYSMAIFSQENKKTEIDFRQYDDIFPNRNVPYKVPTAIDGKLKKLMKLLNLNTGSIDLILNDENEFVFLEVNPVGQFGMVSYPCNYKLEKIIAQYFV